MAHEIFGDRFISRSIPAWHEIAREIFADDLVITAGEAMQRVAGDIVIEQVPLTYGVDVRDSGYTAIVRKPTAEDPNDLVLGVTAESWAAANYPQLAAALDDLSRNHRVETAGVLKGGGVAFLCFRAPDFAVKGDDCKSYFAANFSLTPGIGHKLLHSPVRVVCQNTLTLAESMATIALRIPHTQDALQRIELAARIASQLQSTREKAVTVFNAFADRYVSRAECDAIFQAAFPYPALPAKVQMMRQHLDSTDRAIFEAALNDELRSAIERAEATYERDCATMDTYREAAHQQFEEFEPTRLAGTVWAAYNAATEVSDWRKGRNAAESSLYGSRAQEKSRAFAASLQLVRAA